MHELAIATALVEQLEEILRKEGSVQLLAFTLELGEWSGIEREALEFALPLVMEKSSFPGAKIIINPVKAEVLCRQCCQTAPLENKFIMRCPACGAEDVTLVKGRDFLIKCLEIDDGKEQPCVQNAAVTKKTGK